MLTDYGIIRVEQYMHRGNKPLNAFVWTDTATLPRPTTDIELYQRDRSYSQNDVIVDKKCNLYRARADIDRNAIVGIDKNAFGKPYASGLELFSFNGEEYLIACYPSSSVRLTKYSNVEHTEATPSIEIYKWDATNTEFVSVLASSAYGNISGFKHILGDNRVILFPEYIDSPNDYRTLCFDGTDIVEDDTVYPSDYQIIRTTTFGIYDYVVGYNIANKTLSLLKVNDSNSLLKLDLVSSITITSSMTMSDYMVFQEEGVLYIVAGLEDTNSGYIRIYYMDNDTKQLNSLGGFSSAKFTTLKRFLWDGAYYIAGAVVDNLVSLYQLDITAMTLSVTASPYTTIDEGITSVELNGPILDFTDFTDTNGKHYIIAVTLDKLYNNQGYLLTLGWDSDTSQLIPYSRYSIIGGASVAMQKDLSQPYVVVGLWDTDNGAVGSSDSTFSIGWDTTTYGVSESIATTTTDAPFEMSEWELVTTAKTYIQPFSTNIRYTYDCFCLKDNIIYRLKNRSTLNVWDANNWIEVKTNTNFRTLIYYNKDDLAMTSHGDSGIAVMAKLA